MALTQYYVDPQSGSDAGGVTGAIGDPWLTPQHALDTITRDAVNGDQLNIRDSAATANPVAGLSLAAYGAPTNAASLVIRGYTDAADDGGIALIDGTATTDADGLIGNPAYDSIGLIDLHLQNFATTYAIHLDNQCVVVNVYVEASGSNGIFLDIDAVVLRCRVWGPSASAIRVLEDSIVAFNWVEDDGGALTNSIVLGGTDSSVMFNIVEKRGDANAGIRCISSSCQAIGNTVYGWGAPACDGIEMTAAMAVCLNNYVEGFSGVGAIGVNVTGNSSVVGYNKGYNNTTPIVVTKPRLNLGNNDLLGASPLTNPAGGDFSVDDTLKALGWPSTFLGDLTAQFLDTGAAQREEEGGGGSIFPGLVVR